MSSNVGFIIRIGITFTYIEESKVVESREIVDELRVSAESTAQQQDIAVRQELLVEQKAQLKERAKELDRITAVLKWAINVFTHWGLFTESRMIPLIGGM